MTKAASSAIQTERAVTDRLYYGGLRPLLSCQKVLVRQLRQGAQLLARVGGATISLDTSSLSQISGSGASMQAEIQPLQELER